jgi:hypothetical protein
MQEIFASTTTVAYTHNPSCNAAVAELGTSFRIQLVITHTKKIVMISYPCAFSIPIFNDLFVIFLTFKSHCTVVDDY